MKLHLVDGTYELFRHHYGAPQRQAPSGMEVGACIGLLRSLLYLVQQPEVTHVGCAFDHVIPSFRNELYAGYKTGEGIEPRLLAQFSLAETVAESLGLVVWPGVELEADDLLASASRWIEEPEVEQVILCTPDKDLAQCVKGASVVCWDRRRGKILDERGVVEKFGVPPSAIPDLLALTGDAADGIPGIPRWGAKSAAIVLSRYGSIEAIPDQASEWDVAVRGAQALAENLSRRREEALLFKRLTTLVTDAPLGETPASLEWRGAFRGQMEPLCEFLGESGLLERVSIWRD